jgi:excinuclease ABC subunit A
MKQRLAESFEAALRIADGRAIALEMDSRPLPRRRRVGSAASSPARCAATRCPNWSRACSASTRRWAPARSCDGLGQVTVFDPERVVAFPS